MDNLVYTYDSGNKLTKVLDNGNDNYGFVDGANTATEYTYDQNGNLTKDDNKGITNIDYNHLNLPELITLGGGTISYIYDATGTKLRKTVGSSVTEYAGNYIYQNGQLQFFSHPEGYVTADGQGGYDYVYNYTDHLGNVRLSYMDNNGTTEIVEENNYYPFGLKHKGYNDGISPLGNSVAKKWKYQGQELTDELELNIYEWKYRISDPAIGRFWQIDPLAEDYAYNGTYNFAENRVVEGLEIEGLEMFAIHGTYSDPSFMTSTSREQIGKVFGNKKSYSPQWSGENSVKARIDAASSVAEYVLKKYDKSESNITLVGHSHGGNVGILVANKIREELGENVEINLVTINTPVRDDTQLSKDADVNHYNIYNKYDLIQWAGQWSERMKNGGLSRQTYDGAINIEYDDQISGTDSSGCGISNHCGTASDNINEWLSPLTRARQRVQDFQRDLRDLRSGLNDYIGSAGRSDQKSILSNDSY